MGKKTLFFKKKKKNIWKRRREDNGLTYKIILNWFIIRDVRAEIEIDLRFTDSEIIDW